VLVGSPRSNSNFFGDILPFYSSYKELTQIIVATQEGLVNLIFLSRVFFICISSIISELFNNLVYRSFISLNLVFSVARAVPKLANEWLDLAIELYDILTSSQSRGIWWLERKLGYRELASDLNLKIDNLISVSKKLYLTFFVGFSLLLLSLVQPIQGSFNAVNNTAFAGESQPASFLERAAYNHVINELSSPVSISISQEIASGYGSTLSELQLDRIIEHTVIPSDSVESIAEIYGLEAATVIFNNSITDGTLPEKLILPTSDGYIYMTRVDTKPDELERIYSIDKNLIYSENEDIFDQTNGVFPANTLVLLPTTDFSSITVANKAEEQRIANLELAQQQKSRTKVNTARTGSTAQTYADTRSSARSLGFIWPTAGRITRCVTGSHVGCDIANPSMPPIFAAQSGTVVGVYRYSVSGYGLAVVVDHGNGIQTLYAHMSEIYVTRGQSVLQGQSVGRMGNTGNSTGTHLHFEVRVNGKKQNPLNYLP
jgi:murein DD-endopeptidase MepM/ murein hydrolase activator NlpD